MALSTPRLTCSTTLTPTPSSWLFSNSPEISDANTYLAADPNPLASKACSSTNMHSRFAKYNPTSLLCTESRISLSTTPCTMLSIVLPTPQTRCFTVNATALTSRISSTLHPVAKSMIRWLNSVTTPFSIASSELLSADEPMRAPPPRGI